MTSIESTNGVSMGMLSFAEQQLWIGEQDPTAAFPFIDCAWHLPIAVRIEGPLNRGALTASLNEAVRRHAVLRSRFVDDCGAVRRVCDRFAGVEIREVDLRGQLPDAQLAVDETVRAHRQGLDLTRGPVLHGSLLAFDARDHLLVLTVHHIVFDRWSKRVLARELSELYGRLVFGGTPRLEALNVGYEDYVRWQRARLATTYGRELAGYWTTKLSGLTDLTLPSDGDREPTVRIRSSSCRFSIAPADVERLVALSRGARVTIATALLAIFKLLLHRLSGQEDIAVGVPLSDRRRPEFERLIGLFMNAVVVRNLVTCDLTFLELLGRVRRTLTDACRYQDLPYGYLLQVLDARTPPYRVLFNYMPPITGTEVALAGTNTTSCPVPLEPEAFADLSIHVRGGAQGALGCRILYRAELFSAARVGRMALQFRNLVRAVLDNPEIRVGTVGLADTIAECETANTVE